MDGFRLGDIIDDYCVKCRRLTNHAIVSIVDSAAAKVRCRTCYHDHDYRHEQPPPSKKDLKKAELFAQVLAGAGAPQSADGTAGAVEAAPEHEAEAPEVALDDTTETVPPEPVEEPVPVPAPVAKKRARKTAK